MLDERPPRPKALTGGSSLIAQAALSMLWTSDCAMSSPESQLKWYQLRNWYWISLHSGWRSTSR